MGSNDLVPLRGQTPATAKLVTRGLQRAAQLTMVDDRLPLPSWDSADYMPEVFRSSREFERLYQEGNFREAVVALKSRLISFIKEEDSRVGEGNTFFEWPPVRLSEPDAFVRWILPSSQVPTRELVDVYDTLMNELPPEGHAAKRVFEEAFLAIDEFFRVYSHRRASRDR